MPLSRHLVRVDAHDYRDGQETDIHRHDEHQLTYARSGVLTVNVESSRWVVPPLRAVWIPAGISHSVQAHGQTGARLSFIHQSVDLPLPNRVSVLRVSSLLRAIIEELRHDQTDGDVPGPESATARPHLEALFALQVQQHSPTDDQPAQPLRLPILFEPRLLKIEEALRQTPSDRRTLKQWGQFCGSSERTLTRLFLAETGTTFSHWRTQLRLQHALVQLAQGVSVTSAAHGCGYQSTSAFIESFRSVLGTTPGRHFRT